jgi:hypothetical protein
MITRQQIAHLRDILDKQRLTLASREKFELAAEIRDEIQQLQLYLEGKLQYKEIIGLVFLIAHDIGNTKELNEDGVRIELPDGTIFHFEIQEI